MLIAMIVLLALLTSGVGEEASGPVEWTVRSQAGRLDQDDPTPGTSGIVVGIGFGALSNAKEKAEPGQSYRFVLDAHGGAAVTFRGLITVDGKDRVITRGKTPFEFGCEAGSIIAGYFETLDAGGLLQLRVFDPEYSRRRAALRVDKFPRVRFSWAQPGVGPRCADSGQGACPDSTPSVDEMRKRLESR